MVRGRQKRRLIGCVAAAILSALAIRAGDVRGDGPRVDYLDTQVAHVADQRVLLRSSIQITGGKQRWFSVYFHFRLDAKTAIVLPNGKKFLALWGSLYPPSNVAAAHYDNITMPIPVKGIEAAVNLPKGKRTLLWGVCDVWDPAAKKYLGSGSQVRTPLLVTIDRTGKVTGIDTFNTGRLRPDVNDADAKFKARKATLKTTHVALRQTVALHRAADVTGGTKDVLVVGDYQAPLGSPNRGYFFEKIDTPQKAREFALIGFSDDVVIETEAQYQAIVKALKARGWQKQHLAGIPPALGVTVKEEPGLGYRVEATILIYSNSLKILRGVVHVRCNVAYDGRLGQKVTRLVKAPELPFGVAPGWKQPMPMDPADYDELLAGLLVDEGTQRIPSYVTVTDEVVTVPCARGEDPQTYKDPPQPKE